MTTFRFAIPFVSALLLFTGTTIARADEATTTVRATPASTQCYMSGWKFGRMIGASEKLALPRSAGPITMTCRAPGYHPAVARIEAGAAIRVYSNLTAGTGIAPVVDMMQGASAKYPASLNIVLEPRAFISALERDIWFDRRRVAMAAKWDGVLEALRGACDTGEKTTGPCATQMNNIQTGWDADLHRIDQRRKLALIQSEIKA